MSDESKPGFRLRVVLVGTVAGLLAIAAYAIFSELLDPLLWGGLVSLVRFVRVLDFANPRLGIFLVGLIALGVGVHLFARWLSSEGQRLRADVEGKPWRKRWSASIVALVLTFFLAGICALGVVHQTTWLFTDPDGFWRDLRPTFRSIDR